MGSGLVGIDTAYYLLLPTLLMGILEPPPKGGPPWPASLASQGQGRATD